MTDKLRAVIYGAQWCHACRQAANSEVLRRWSGVFYGTS